MPSNYSRRKLRRATPAVISLEVRAVLWLAQILLLTVAVSARTPRLTGISPTGAQRGTEVEVRLTGQRLDQTQEIIFYGPGLKAAGFEAGQSNVVKATFQIDSDCPLGEHPVRLRTATGVSEIRTFWVGPFPTVTETEPNNEAAKAQELSLNSTVAGAIPAEDMDHFAVNLEKGQRLTAEIEAIRLGRGAFDSVVSILDAQGRILATSDDSVLTMQDGIVSLVAPASGRYLVQVRETAFGGRDEYLYRLHVGTFPRPTAVYPAAGQAGTKLNVKFVGDAGGELSREMELPKSPQEKFGVFAQVPNNPTAAPAMAALSSPSPNWMRVSAFACALEAEPNDTREQAGAARETPVVFNGIISRPGDQDWFRFRAKKGMSLQVNVLARRLRSPLDSAIQIVNARGSSLADNDDAGGPDSGLTFKPDEDGEYAVLVRDHLRRGRPDFVYALEIALVTPSLTLKIPEVARNDTQSRQHITIPRGNRFATLISARRANFSEDLTFRMDGLPSGVSMRAEPLGARVDAGAIIFEAAPDAPIGGRLLDLVASTTNGIEGHFRNDIDLVQGPNNTSFYGTRVDKLYVAVTEAAPFRLRIVEPKVPLVRGGAMDLRLEVEREQGFEEPISVKLVWNPPGVTSQSDVTIPKGQNSVAFPLNARNDAETRSWKVAVLGSVTLNGGPLHVSSAFAGLEVAAPFLSAKIETSAVEPGKSTNVTVKLEHSVPFDGKAVIRLLGLPEKAAVPAMEITKDSTNVVFPVTVDPKCPTGSHKNLFCAVAIPKDGETIAHNIGAGGILRIVPPRKPSAGGVGKVARAQSDKR